MLIRQLEKFNTKLKLKNVETLACYDDFEKNLQERRAYMAIYDNVKHFAETRGMSIRQIELQAGLSNGSIRKWNNSKPDVFKVRSVAKILNVTIDDLL